LTESDRNKNQLIVFIEYTCVRIEFY